MFKKLLCRVVGHRLVEGARIVAEEATLWTHRDERHTPTLTAEVWCSRCGGTVFSGLFRAPETRFVARQKAEIEHLKKVIDTQAREIDVLVGKPFASEVDQPGKCDIIKASTPSPSKGVLREKHNPPTSRESDDSSNMLFPLLYVATTSGPVGSSDCSAESSSPPSDCSSSD